MGLLNLETGLFIFNLPGYSGKRLAVPEVGGGGVVSIYILKCRVC